MRKLIAIIVTLMMPVSLYPADLRVTTGGSGTACITDGGSGTFRTTSTAGGGAPVTEATLIQEMDARNTYNSPNDPGSVSVTFDQTAGEDNLIYVALAVDKHAVSFDTPAGYTLIESAVSGSATNGVSGACFYKIAAGNETSLTVTWTATSPNAEEGNVYVAEYDDIDPLDPLDQSAENDTNVLTTVSSNSSGTTPATDETYELAIAMYASDSGNSVGSNTPRISWDNSFTSQFEEPFISESGNPFLAVAVKNLSATGTVETTGSHGGSDEAYTAVATFHLQ